LPSWGFWRVAALALLIQLPPNVLLHFNSTSLPADWFVEHGERETSDAQQREVEAVVSEIAALAGVTAPAVWLTHSMTRADGLAGISGRILKINPGFYFSLSKRARRALIAHELAHQYDQASRERLVADLAIYIPVGIANAAIILTLLGRIPVTALLSVYIAASVFGELIYTKFQRLNEQQADLLATDILGEKESMLALFHELARHVRDFERPDRIRQLAMTHPTSQKRRLAVERHAVRSHPRRLARLINRTAALVPAASLVAALAALAYWLMA
jgi:hypothetical protein